jgi:hypothetical protein
MYKRTTTHRRKKLSKRKIYLKDLSSRYNLHPNTITKLVKGVDLTDTFQVIELVNRLDKTYLKPIKTITIRQLNREYHKHIYNLPLVVTKHGTPFCTINPTKEGKFYGNTDVVDQEKDTTIKSLTPGKSISKIISINQLQRNIKLLENAPLIITKYNIPIYKIDKIPQDGKIL